MEKNSPIKHPYNNVGRRAGDEDEPMTLRWTVSRCDGCNSNTLAFVASSYRLPDPSSRTHGGRTLNSQAQERQADARAWKRRTTPGRHKTQQDPWGERREGPTTGRRGPCQQTNPPEIARTGSTMTSSSSSELFEGGLWTAGSSLELGRGGCWGAECCHGPVWTFLTD